MVQSGTEGTYNMAKTLLDKLQGDTITEFFLPRDMPHFCTGCSNCFSKGENFCPHYTSVNQIVKAMVEAKVLIFTTPVYVLRSSGQMKTFLDHLGYQFMVHRPNKTMFSKVGVVLSTGSGGGMNSAMGDIKTSMLFWGVGKTFSYGKAVYATEWNSVSEKNKNQIDFKLSRLSHKIKQRVNSGKPRLIVKVLFYIMKGAQKKFSNPVDNAHWEREGWLTGKTPW